MGEIKKIINIVSSGDNPSMRIFTSSLMFKQASYSKALPERDFHSVSTLHYKQADSVHFGSKKLKISEKEKAQTLLNTINARTLDTPAYIVNHPDASLTAIQELLQSINDQGGKKLYARLQKEMTENQNISKIQEEHPETFFKILEYFDEYVKKNPAGMLRECELLLRQLPNLEV